MNNAVRRFVSLLRNWPLWSLLVVLALYSWLVHELKIESDVLQITQAEFSPARATEAETLKVSLPDYWRKRDYWQGEAWYRAELDLNVPPDRLWGIYLPSVGTNAEVYLDGNLLGDGGRMSDPPAHNDFRPLYFTIANGMLKSSTNVIEIRVVADTACNGYLGPVSLGPDQLLRPVYERGRFIRVTLVRFVFASILVSLFYVGVLALRTREVIYPYFAGVLAASSIFLTAVVAHEIPVPGWFLEWLRMLGTGWLVVFLIFFIHRFNQLKRPHIEKMLLAWAVLGSIILLLTPREWQYSVGTYSWDVMTILWGVYALYASIRETIRAYNHEKLAMSVSLAIMLGAGVRDWLIHSDNPGAFHGTLLIYAIIYPLAVFAWILLQRFITALHDTKTLNRELERRVEEKEAKLQESYQSLLESKKREALVDERERIMRDMHDGIGGHLISASAIAKSRKSKNLAEILDAALTDLRLMIDSFEPVHNDLSTILGMVRMRLEKRINNHGIQFKWRVGDVEGFPQLDPHRVLHIMRIIEEAVTNVVKHANATEIRVSTFGEVREGKRGTSIEISDNGRGIRHPSSGGRGILNMKKRAREIGGQFSLAAGSPGTIATLWLAPE